MKLTPTTLRSLALSLGCTALVLTGLLTRADRPGSPGHRALPIRAHAGTTFTLVPVEFDEENRPVRFIHTVDGVVRVTLLGNCLVHFDVTGFPHPDGTFALEGTLKITTTDGATTLDAEVEGSTAPDSSGNPRFGNFHYDVRFTGGTGDLEGIRGGRAAVDGFAQFTPDFSAGTATWSMQGNLGFRGYRPFLPAVD